MRIKNTAVRAAEVHASSWRPADLGKLQCCRDSGAESTIPPFRGLVEASVSGGTVLYVALEPAFSVGMEFIRQPSR